MKIWSGYSSEHSMNLVLIGKFKRAQDAENVERAIESISHQVSQDNSHEIAFAEPEQQRFSEGMLSLINKLNIHILGPTDLGQLVSDYHLKRREDSITITTEEAEVSAFVKLFINAGAKVEVFSMHDYPSDSSDSNM